MAIGAECGHYCASCRGEIRGGVKVVPAARSPLDSTAAVGALDEIGEEELWLWRLVFEADRVAGEAPAAPAPDRVEEVERRYASACRAEERIGYRIKATEAALARPGSWLRPGHRSALVRHLKEDRSAAVAAAVHRGRIAQVRNRLRALQSAHAQYLSEHHAILSAGRNARAELDRIFDDLIDGYSRLQPPPAWFRFGLGFPPAPGAQREWLSHARETLAQRRRSAIEEPHW